MKIISFTLIFIFTMLSCKNESHIDLKNKTFLDQKNDIQAKYDAKRYEIFQKGEFVIVKDKSTGLFWQGNSPNMKMTLKDAEQYCTTLAVKGFNNWRLPEITELRTLINREYIKPATLFPKLTRETIWSSSALMMRKPHSFYRVNFYDGSIHGADKNRKHKVICVQSHNLDINKPAKFKRFFAAGDYMIQDLKTNLLWTTPIRKKVAWNQASQMCMNIRYGDYADWRLPKIEELETLINYQVSHPVSTFPKMPSKVFWSASKFLNKKMEAWAVRFYGGIVESKVMGNKYFFMCVREP